MAFTLVQSGTTLEMYDTSGNHGTVTLPTGITLASGRVPRFTIFGRYVVVVNTPSRPITVDPEGIARVLCPRPPTMIPTLSGQNTGTLSGQFLARQTFVIKDAAGNIIAESEMGPTPTAVTISVQALRAANLGLSLDDVTETRMYRTTHQGAVYLPWVTLGGNTQTAIQDDMPDAGLGLAAIAPLGTPPDLTLIAEFRGRLFGVDRNLIDDLRYCETGRMWAWPAVNTFPIPRAGSDSRGIVSLLSRKDALGVGRINSLQQVISNSDNSAFKPVKVTENCGVISHESVAVFVDTAYFLWIDGVYQWNNEGVKCISDGKVRSWFATGDYFNQSKFNVAFGYVDPNTKRYKLFLCSAGSSTVDRWVEYDITTGKWWGPHKTGAFTPSCTLISPTVDDVLVPMIGSTSGYLWKERALRTDSAATAIDFDVDTKRHDAQTPQTDKAWLDLLVSGTGLTSGRVAVTPSVGDVTAEAAARALQYDLTQPTQQLGRVGTGAHCKLNFRETTVGQDVQLTGYEMNFYELGRR